MIKALRPKALAVTALALSPLALTACVTAAEASPPADGIARAGLNQRVYVDGPYVTPLKVLEDSRCPINVRCVWAGRLKLSIKVDLGSGSETHEIATDQPIQVADGELSLVEVRPDRVKGGETKAEPYRFGFRFAGGY